MWLALGIFGLTYVLLLLIPKYRAYVALGSALIFIIVGYMPINEIFGSINWNVILMIFGTMGVVSLFIESKMPALLADKIIQKTPNVKWAVISMALFAGLISAFIDNVATVIIVAPIALTIARKMKISPVPIIISIAVAANLEGAATLVGDTTSILLGAEANMNFFDFFFFEGKPGLFFIVQAGMLASTLFLFFFFRKETHTIEIKDTTEVTDYVPTALLLGIIILLIIASFIPNTPAITNGLICTGLMVIGMIYTWFKKKDLKAVGKVLSEVDFFTLLLLAGLFIVVQSITNAGVIDAISDLIHDLSGGNIFVVYTIFVWLSVLLSAFIDNIPYVATMLPVATAIALRLNVDPYVLYFGLLIGATLGGNLTPIGASANIAGIGILRKEGYEVKTWDFMKIGLPFTFTAVTVGYLMIWFFFA